MDGRGLNLNNLYDRTHRRLLRDEFYFFGIHILVLRHSPIFIGGCLYIIFFAFTDCPFRIEWEASGVFMCFLWIEKHWDAQYRSGAIVHMMGELFGMQRRVGNKCST